MQAFLPLRKLEEEKNEEEKSFSSSEDQNERQDVLDSEKDDADLRYDIKQLHRIENQRLN